MDRATSHALQRFGLGPRGDEAVSIGEPRAWLLAQLRPAPLPEALQGIASTPPAALGARGDAAARQQLMRDARQRYLEQSARRFVVQLQSERPLHERLVMFWSNHFCVSVQKPVVAGLANRYEVEAIRPHVSGRFADMLLAVARHPAMLLYLDNAQSVGPDSRAGRRRDRGLNENFARELLELHTLGVDGPYGQNDVIALARILTGWSLARGDDGPVARHAYRPELHQPGTKTLLGQSFGEAGEAEGEQALRLLARHPATARHLCTKLARHFVADQPPPALVERLARTWQDSDGDLARVMAALIGSDEAWAQSLAKLKTPYEFALASLRLCQLVPEPMQVIQGLEALDARPFNAPSPAGLPDTASDWNAPNAILKRVSWAHRLGQRLPPAPDPMAIADQALGPLLGDNSRRTIARAASAQDAFALLLASPEFQRR